MPICKKCNRSFPNFMVIDGKKRNLHNRKYCLECSPFGLHNTRPIDEQSFKKDIECICKICGRKYIYCRNNKRGHTKKHCNSCIVNKKRFTVKIKAVKYKGGKCVKCGYFRCKQVLEFHHLNSNEKDFRISGCHSYSWERIKKELDKCILLCSNCHREVHYDYLKLNEPEKHLGCICEIDEKQFEIKNININYCKDCNKEISRRAKRCWKCNSIKQYKVDRPSPEVLAKDIKELGYSGTGRKYGVTGNAIRKWIY